MKAEVGLRSFPHYPPAGPMAARKFAADSANCQSREFVCQVLARLTSAACLLRIRRSMAKYS